jgi:hypothetical protein
MNWRMTKEECVKWAGKEFEKEVKIETKTQVEGTRK